MSDVNAFQNLSKTDTSLRRTLWSVPRVSVLRGSTVLIKMDRYISIFIYLQFSKHRFSRMVSNKKCIYTRFCFENRPCDWFYIPVKISNFKGCDHPNARVKPLFQEFPCFSVSLFGYFTLKSSGWSAWPDMHVVILFF